MILKDDKDIRANVTMTLTPTLQSVDTTEGRRTHAAFLVQLQFQLKHIDSHDGQELYLSGDAFHIFDRQISSLIQGNSFDDDPLGGKHLAALGIPATYAATFQELRDFFGRQEGELHRAIAVESPGLSGATLSYRERKHGTPPAASEAILPSSLTMRYGPSAFKHPAFGNYREMVADYGINAGGDARVIALACRFNTEKGNFVVMIPNKSSFSEMHNVEFNNGSVTLAFTLVDQRHHS